MSRVAVIGSRGYDNYEEFKEKLKYYVSNLKSVTFVSGGAKSGADHLIKKFCKEFNYELKEYLPDWEKFGKSAGMIRNQYIIDDSDYLIAFWDEMSKGTKNSIERAEYKQIPIRIIKI